ncbi:UbiX family flavin prenyltransferase [Desulfosporosinus lacus]|uniref:Flavin prenyltransferase UbiX n=1 Tax=Desulfosporosinus lacus DSM 15449 TaxID=1121420 RepID=A0A1M5Z0E5_9FIRM|nr:UbiX family flavin prenyltransferase [Desulfosporosinus lacus]SHI17701.1 3-octaprenyl-4hydroxybenzoate decarboxylase [Desulfosporosinus lacus DSM 15449]
MKLIVGISGATGAIYGIRMLQTLGACQIESHLVLTDSAKRTIETETNFSVKEVENLADYVYDNRDIGASISSGSFKTDGMLIAPCAIKSLSALANSYNDSLLVRAADVVLKERRKLVVIPRETPLHIGHLKLLTAVAEMGAVILPPMPAYYHMPKTIDDIINQTVGKALDQFDVSHQLFKRWEGGGTRQKLRTM